MVSARMVLTVEILEFQFGRENVNKQGASVFFSKLLL